MRWAERLVVMGEQKGKYRIRRRFDDNSSLVLWRDVAAPDDTVIEEIANRQQSQMLPMDVAQFETDWLFVEQRKKKRGWQVLRTVALGFDCSATSTD